MEVAGQHFEHKNVLIVDDDNDIREAISQILEYEGYEVTTAANGQEGLDCIKSKRPSLILLDLMMPVMNGWQFKSELDSDPGLSEIPVVVLSADGSVQQRQNELGRAGYLKKPIQLETLLDTVRHYTKNSSGNKLDNFCAVDFESDREATTKD